MVFLQILVSLGGGLNQFGSRTQHRKVQLLCYSANVRYTILRYDTGGEVLSTVLFFKQRLWPVRLLLRWR